MLAAGRRHRGNKDGHHDDDRSHRLQRNVWAVPTFDDVARIALALPEATEVVSRGLRQWRVKDKLFVWERPLRRSDLEALGDAVPDGPILGVRTEHLVAKEAILADASGVFFTTPHFNGYPAVLVKLDEVGPDDLQEVIVEAWLARAPPKLAEAYLQDHS
jgi:hypothetical protein